MRIAYIISAYKLPEQLHRLILKLNNDCNTFFVHVDKKTPADVYAEMVRDTGHLSNVNFLKRHRCYWGGFGHVQATIAGIIALFNKNIPFDYAILLTGQDYPIKTNVQISAFLEQNRGKSFMEYFPLPNDNWENGGLERLEQWHLYTSNRHFVFPKNRDFFIKRKFPRGFQPFGGSSYWCLSRESIGYLHRFILHNHKFVNFFKYVDVPDEIFFQTILLNSPQAGCIVNDDLRYIEWKDPDSGSPSILVKEDFEKLAKSTKLFARKFDRLVDAEILDQIDQQLLDDG
jgi:hypothetical protein